MSLLHFGSVQDKVQKYARRIKNWQNGDTQLLHLNFF